MEITFSIIVFCMNIAILKIGNENQMSSFGIINYLTTIVYMLLLGLSFGIQPLFSFNHGANNSEKVSQFYKFTILSTLVINSVYFVTLYFFGYEVISLFTKDVFIVRETYVGLCLFNVSFFIIGINVIQSGYYQAINDPGKSNIISFMRSFVFFPVTLFFSSKVWGLNGIWLATLFSETFCFFASNILFSDCNFFKKSLRYAKVLK
ncbi:MAG: MATE family efflux transporter [Cetobacterium sp.]